MEIKTVGVVGCGLMGSGIAQICAEAGYAVRVREVSDDLAGEGDRAHRVASSRRASRRARSTPERAKEILGRLPGTTSLDALADCDLVIEAIVENLALKREVYGALDAACPPHTLFASNTSSLSITDMAAPTKRADRFVGPPLLQPRPAHEARGGRALAPHLGRVVRAGRMRSRRPWARPSSRPTDTPGLRREPAARALPARRDPRAREGRRRRSPTSTRA